MPNVSPNRSTPGQTKVTVTSYSQRIKSTVGPVNTYVYKNNIIGEINRSSSRNGVLSGNFRRPTYHRAFYGRVDSEDFDFTYSVAGSIYHAWGETDLRKGQGLPNYIRYGTRLDGGLIVPDVSQNMINQSVTEALNKLNSEKINIAVSMAEARKTVTQMASLISRIARSAIALKRGNVAQAIRIVTGSRPGQSVNPGNPWLEYQYGVRPLINDVIGLAQAAERGLRNAGHHVHVQRRMTSNLPLPKNPTPSVYDIWQPSGSCKIGVETHFYAKVDSAHLDLLSSLGLTNPLSVIWELTPYSFVIDWLLPIGNILQALSSSLGLEFVAGFTNTKSWCKLDITACEYFPIGGKLPTAKFSNVAQKRITYATFPLPRFYVKSPFSTTHVISAIALINNARRR